MLTEIQRNHLSQAVRPMQIIVGALVAGVLTFLVIALVVRAGQEPAGPFISYVAVGFTVFSLVAWVIVPNVVTSRARESVAAGQSGGATDLGSEETVVQLAGFCQTRLIVASALLEGAAFFNLVAYLLEGRWLSLGSAIVLLLIMVSQIPTTNRLEDWVSRELETIEQMLV